MTKGTKPEKAFKLDEKRIRWQGHSVGDERLSSVVAGFSISTPGPSLRLRGHLLRFSALEKSRVVRQ
jgi:hypothetical protein